MSWKKLTSYPNQQVVEPSYDSSITYWKIENGKVWHQWKKLMKADVDTFEIYESNDFIARDKDHVYHAWTKPAKVDRDTFQEIGDCYWIDQNYAYLEYETSLKPLKGMDAKSFHYVGNGYAYDQHFAYHFGRVLKSCKHPTTLQVVRENPNFAKDLENIFYESAVLKNVDLQTWRLLENSFSRDEKRIFFTARKLPKADIHTWEHLHRAYSRDKNHVYCMEQIQKDKSPAEWTKERVIQHYEETKTT